MIWFSWINDEIRVFHLHFKKRYILKISYCSIEIDVVIWLHGKITNMNSQRHCTVWKLQTFSLTLVSQKFRENNGFIKWLVWRIFFFRENFLFSTLWVWKSCHRQKHEKKKKKKNFHQINALPNKVTEFLSRKFFGVPAFCSTCHIKVWKLLHFWQKIRESNVFTNGIKYLLNNELIWRNIFFRLNFSFFHTAVCTLGSYYRFTLKGHLRVYIYVWIHERKSHVIL